MTKRLQLRRGTSSEWSTANPVLAAGEIGLDTDTGDFKIGNGSTAWNSQVSYKTINNTWTLKDVVDSYDVIATAPTGTIILQLDNAANFHFTTAATANFIFNLKRDTAGSTTFNSKLGVGESITITANILTGSTAYKMTALQIDGTAQTVYWVNNDDYPSLYPSSWNIYTLNILKTATDTYFITASSTRYA